MTFDYTYKNIDVSVLQFKTGMWYDFYWEKVGNDYEKVYDNEQKDWKLD